MASGLFGFAYSAPALAYLKTIPVKLRKQIVGKIQALGAEPRPRHCKLVQSMKGGEEKVYRIRSGDYRILYVIRNKPDQIVVLDIDHRKDVYR